MRINISFKLGRADFETRNGNPFIYQLLQDILRSGFFIQKNSL
jgi:hypothetical protein